MLKRCDEIYPMKKQIKYKEKIDLAQNTQLLKLQELNNFENEVKETIKKLSIAPEVKKIDSEALISDNSIPNTHDSSNMNKSNSVLNPVDELRKVKLNLLKMVTDA